MGVAAFCVSERQAVARDLQRKRLLFVDRKRLLFVDDEASIRLTLPHILSKCGFEVTSVASVNDAVKEIKAQRFDALLSDLNLPQPDEGFAVVQAMRQHQPRCVNFVLTGYPGDASVEEATKHKVAYYFTKPVDINDLLQTIMDKLSKDQE